MESEIDRIYSFSAKGKNEEEGFSDIIVYLSNQRKYFACFFSHKKIESLRAEFKQTGENLSGLYIWNKDMLIVENCRLETIEKVIQHLLDEGEFFEVFRRL